jgi:DNA replication protein DnaC
MGSQDREEMEVLFTLLAERYERFSVIITTNLVFSEGSRLFKDSKLAEYPTHRSSGFSRHDH